MKLVLLLTFVLSFSAVAQDSPLEYSRKFKQELDQVKDLEPEEFPKKIDTYRESLERYIQHKKRVCNGEFSTIVLGGVSTEAKPRRKKNKLSREERTLCFRELKGFQITLVNNIYIARKRFLNFLHEKRLKELDKTRNSTIGRLQKSFSKGRRL